VQHHKALLCGAFRVTRTAQLNDLRSCTTSLTTCLRADAADMQQLLVGLHEAALQSEHGIAIAAAC
jgi:hypothetical protein